MTLLGRIRRADPRDGAWRSRRVRIRLALSRPARTTAARRILADMAADGGAWLWQDPLRRRMGARGGSKPSCSKPGAGIFRADHSQIRKRQARSAGATGLRRGIRQTALMPWSGRSVNCWSSLRTAKVYMSCTAAGTQKPPRSGASHNLLKPCPSLARWSGSRRRRRRAEPSGGIV